MFLTHVEQEFFLNLVGIIEIVYLMKKGNKMRKSVPVFRDIA